MNGDKKKKQARKLRVKDSKSNCFKKGKAELKEGLPGEGLQLHRRVSFSSSALCSIQNT